MNRKALLQISLIVIGISQIFFGIGFTFVPAKFAAMLSLTAAPEWAYWLLGMFGARCFGFGYGMFLAARNPTKYAPWIQAMVGVQAIDWLGTLYYIMNGGITISQASSAVYLPIIFIVVLLVFYPRNNATSDMAA